MAYLNTNFAERRKKKIYASLWHQTKTRPDIAFAVNHAFKYLKNTFKNENFKRTTSNTTWEIILLRRKNIALSTKEAEYSNLINRMNIRINIGTDNKSCKDITENPFSEFQAQIHFINFTIEMNVLTIAVICVIALMNRKFLINSNNDNNIKFLSGSGRVLA
ncbi:hypothetical protein U3516DRAFT_769485 [Neocallimastix sp. 'constans']